MRVAPFAPAFYALIVVLLSPVLVADNVEPGHHELHGPVEVAWESHYDGPTSASDSARDLALSRDGSTVFVTGSSLSIDTYPDYVTAAYRAVDGEPIWSVRYDGPASGRDYANSIGISPDGTMVFVTGDSEGSAFDRDYATVAYDAETGEMIWIMRYSGGPGASAWSLGVSPDGSTVFVTGSSGDYQFDGDYTTVAYDAATGEQVWIAHHGQADQRDSARWLAPSPDGSTVFVTGSAGIGAGADFVTLAYDAATGEEIWLARHDGPASESDYVDSLTVSPDGSTVFVTGAVEAIGTRKDYATIAYDSATGEEIWIAVYDGTASNDDSPAALTVSPDDSTLFLTGSSVRTGHSRDCTTIAYGLTRTVTIDVRPTSINPSRRGVVPVAIMGDESLDVTEIDVTTLRLGPGEAACAHDLSDAFVYNTHLEDTNLDGLMDLMTHFRTQEVGIVCGDNSITLTGRMLGGRSIEGRDNIRTVSCRSARTRPDHPRNTESRKGSSPLRPRKVD